MPRFVRPMLAVSAPGPFDSPGYLFEPKWDGVRAVGFRDGERVWLQSRGGLSFTEAFPEVAGALARAPGPSRAVVDGELVTVGPDGRPRVAAVLARIRMRRPAAIRAAALEWPAVYAIFDLLYLDGRDLRRHPLRQRRAALESWAAAWGEGRLLLSPAGVGQGRRLFEAVRERGLEGVMAKALESPYREGRRTPEWLKVKAFVEAQAVVVGFVPSGTTGVRSLAVALPHPGKGGLDFAGLVGTGLPSAEQARLRARLEPLRLASRPLRPGPPGPELLGTSLHVDSATPRTMRWARHPDGPAPPALHRAGHPELQEIAWVRPELVCRVRYLERTADGWLRHASYRGLVEPAAGYPPGDGRWRGVPG